MTLYVQILSQDSHVLIDFLFFPQEGAFAVRCTPVNSVFSRGLEGDLQPVLAVAQPRRNLPVESVLVVRPTRRIR